MSPPNHRVEPTAADFGGESWYSGAAAHPETLDDMETRA
jgi:hypothetical protein